MTPEKTAQEILEELIERHVAERPPARQDETRRELMEWAQPRLHLVEKGMDPNFDVYAYKEENALTTPEAGLLEAGFAYRPNKQAVEAHGSVTEARVVHGKETREPTAEELERAGMSEEIETPIPDPGKNAVQIGKDGSWEPKKDKKDKTKVEAEDPALD